MPKVVSYLPEPESIPKCEVPNCTSKQADSQLVMLNIAYEFVIVPTCRSHNNAVINAQPDGLVEVQRYGGEDEQ